MALMEVCFFYIFCVIAVSTINPDYLDRDPDNGKQDYGQDYDSYNAGFNTDVCILAIKPFSTPDKRLTSYVLGENETPISDTALSFDWYGQPNYKIYSGSDPGTSRCGTTNPVYFTDDSEAGQSTNITGVWACVHSENNGCSYRIPISVTFCEQLNHHIYRLSPELPTNAGLCLETFNSQLNYITDVEVIIPTPVEEDGQMKYQFRCLFDLSTSENFWYHVTWYRDGQLIKSFPPISHSNDPVDGSVLDESMFGGGLGFKVQCSYAVSLQAESETGYVKKSAERFVGIELITPTVNVADGSRSDIKVRPTIPIGCPSSNPECSLSVNIIEPASTTSSCNPESSFSDCGISISSANWDQEYSVKLSADPATQYGSKSAFNTITLKTSSSFPSHSIWQDYTIGTVTIRTSQDTAAYQGKSCSAVCDPHMRTFGGLSYEHQYGGSYTLYENTEWKQEIQMKTAPCIASQNGKPYCPCGVAVRVGREVFVIERCAPLEYWKIEYLQCSSTGVKLIDIKKSGNKYEFKLPSGLILKTTVYQKRDFINLYLYPSQADTTATGLCGQVGSAIFYKRDRTTVAHVNYPGMPDFSSSWSVPDANIDLFSDEVHLLDPVETGGFFCKCTTPVGSTEPQFTCEKSDDTCAVTIGSSESVDQCTVGSLTSKRSVDSHRVRRNADNLKKDRKKRATTVLTWRNDWNETTATNYCNKLFDDSAFVDKCKTIPNVDLSFPRANCVSDIELIGDTSFALVALETIVYQCIREVTYDSTYHSSATNGGPSLLEAIKEVCPLDCSYHGTCNKGECTCNSGWAGNDCAMDTSIVPVVHHIANDGYCDLNAGSCDAISVYGGDFIDGSSTLCKLSSSQMMENGEFGPKSEIEEPSIIKSIGEVQCGLGKSRKRRSTTTQPDNEFVKVYSVSVSNNGVGYSNSSLVVIFNSMCQFCTITTANNVQCNYTGDFCISDGTCYGNGEPHSQHTCYTCSVENGARKWVKSSGGDCDDDMLWIIGVVLGVVLILVIIAVLVYCVVKKSKTKVGSTDDIKTSPPPYSKGSP